MELRRPDGSAVGRRLLIASVSAVALLGAAYLWWFGYVPPVSFVGLPDGTAKLIDGMDSCAPVDAIVRQIQSRSLRYAIDKYSAPRKETQPPFDITTLTVQDFSHLGEKGELVLEFFNDRLAAALFFPADTPRYRARLASEEGLRLDAAHTETRPAEHTRVWIAVDHLGREYVGWEDLRLAKQMSVWIKRYS